MRRMLTNVGYIFWCSKHKVRCDIGFCTTICRQCEPWSEDKDIYAKPLYMHVEKIIEREEIEKRLKEKKRTSAT